MSKLVEELKKDHVLMVDMLNKVKELGITKKGKSGYTHIGKGQFTCTSKKGGQRPLSGIEKGCRN